MIRIYLALLFCATVISCKKKETIVEVEKEVIVYREPEFKWKRVPHFDLWDLGQIKTLTARPAASFFLAVLRLIRYMIRLKTISLLETGHVLNVKKNHS